MTPAERNTKKQELSDKIEALKKQAYIKRHGGDYRAPAEEVLAACAEADIMYAEVAELEAELHNLRYNRGQSERGLTAATDLKPSDPASIPPQSARNEWNIASMPVGYQLTVAASVEASARVAFTNYKRRTPGFTYVSRTNPTDKSRTFWRMS